MYEFGFKLDGFQEEALDYIEKGKSVVVCAPTGAGKTCIGEFAIIKALKNNEKIFYTTPLKALSNQKFSDFQKKYGKENVGLLTGDTSINRNANIVVMTTEVFRNMLYGTNFGTLGENLKNVKYVVLDEVHYMNDEQRGTVWEESIIYCPSDVQIIALSATIHNSLELTNWINSVHSKTELVYTDFRPVPLKHYHFDPTQPTKLFPLLTPNGKLNSKINEQKREYGRKNKKNNSSNLTNLIHLLNENNMLPAIYFTFSRKKCDEQMEKCAKLDLTTKEERLKIKEYIDEFIIDNPYLYNNKNLDYLYCGVASHHAGLLPSLKSLTEKLFQEGLIKVVFATETLAAGINMPARTTVISSISKRTDSGHRILTANEFLQMSGRAGRRGMDEVGYVVTVGTQFETPEDVAKLVKSKSNPLESKFTPRYSMVVNLLQRFSMDEAKELILKSFGYFTSTERVKPLISCQNQLNDEIEKTLNFTCIYGHNKEDFEQYQKFKNLYVQTRHVVKMLKKQLKDKNHPEVIKYDNLSKDYYSKFSMYNCEACKCFKKHKKSLEILERLNKRKKALSKEIEYQKDIYWQKFLNHYKVLNDLGYLENDYPTQKGALLGVLRTENELYLSEIILSHILDDLTSYELAGVICSILTEDVRSNVSISQIPISQKLRITLNKVKNLKRTLSKIQENNKIETPLFLNSFFSPLIIMWMENPIWEEIVNVVDVQEGDIVRTFKRTVDVLKQISLLPNINENLIISAKEAINLILKDPIDMN